MKTKSRQVLTVVVLIAAVIATGAYIWFGNGRQAKPLSVTAVPPALAIEPLQPLPVPPPPTSPLATSALAPASAPTLPSALAPASLPASAPALSEPKMDAAAATSTLERGLKLMTTDKLIEARAELSNAYFSGALNDDQAAKARAALTELADITIFSPKIFEGDPYTFQYTFQAGDLMNAVERKLQLRVPSQLVMKINGIASASSVRAGQTIKMVQGPFHAIVSKGNFTLDVYLHRPGAEKIFIRRMKVGLGRNGSTPIGSWKVRLGSKMRNSPWYPPSTSGVRTVLRLGDKDYPLGKEGYWIGLVGTDGDTNRHKGYGIHGTDNPDSIGKAASLGCIRLSDPDIEFVFNTLYEEWSTVQIVQ